jgi:type IV secretion system protein VirB8
MLRKKTSSPQIDGAVAKAANFEVTIADLARRSEKRAWYVAFGALLMSLILAGGYFFMLPLKEKVPFMVMADAYTGTSTIARLDENFDDRRYTTSEAINISNVVHYVMARESYDATLINRRDWVTTYTMSSPDVAAGYTALRSRNNPSSPINLYGTGKSIRVNILSTVLIGGSKTTEPKGATVRFQRSLYEKATGATEILDSKIATLEFVYKKDLKMDEKDRIENPLGFQVTNYRVDSDFAASPPVARQVQAAPAQQQTALPQSQDSDVLLVPEMPGTEDAADPAQPGTMPAPAVPAPAPITQPAPVNNANGASNR